jgi:hypothetical protein
VIQIPRSLAQQVRAVFRRLARKSTLTFDPVVSFEAGPEGLHVRLHNTEVTAEFHQPGALARDSVTIPLDALAEFEGRKKDVVTLEQSGSAVQASWQDGVVPQVREYPAPEQAKVSAIPDHPRETVTNEAEFFKAMMDAVNSASDDAVRYALNRVQLRGKSGEIVATDGRQLLVQSGFQFGWTDDVLIPASAVFACRELPQQESVAIGKSKTHVTMTAGAWTLHFPIDTASRFPKTEQVIPSLTGAVHGARIDPADSKFLTQALPRLPGKEDENSPVTLDLDRSVVVRARAEDGRVTELHLAKSEVIGKPIRVSINRQFLARALDMGLGEVCVATADTPLVFRDERRTFVVMPLGKDGAIGPSDKAVRISSANGESARRPELSEQQTVLPQTETAPMTNGTRKSTRSENKTALKKSTTGTLAALVTEAEALKNELRQAYTRTHQLLAAIKKHRRQNKLVQSTLATLATLRQLKSVAG